MLTPNAKRQAAYRARRKADDSAPTERLNLIIDLHAKRALERLAMCYGVTQKAIVQKLLLDAEHAAIDAATAFTNGQAEYYAGRLRLKGPD